MPQSFLSFLLSKTTRLFQLGRVIEDVTALLMISFDDNKTNNNIPTAMKIEALANIKVTINTNTDMNFLKFNSNYDNDKKNSCSEKEKLEIKVRKATALNLINPSILRNFKGLPCDKENLTMKFG